MVQADGEQLRPAVGEVDRAEAQDLAGGGEEVTMGERGAVGTEVLLVDLVIQSEDEQLRQAVGVPAQGEVLDLAGGGGGVAAARGAARGEAQRVDLIVQA